MLIGIAILFILQRRRKLANRIKQYLKKELEWNEPNDFLIDTVKMQDLYVAYQYMNHTKDLIDDITWNDLEMDGIYTKVDHTKTTMGEIYLYHCLRSPLNQVDKLRERDDLIELFKKQDKLRNDFSMELEQIGKHMHFSIYEYQNELEQNSTFSILPSICAVLIQLLSIASFWINNYVGIILLAIWFAINITTYYKCRSKIERFVPFINQTVSMISKSEILSINTGFQLLDHYLKRMKLDQKIYKKYRKIGQMISFHINGKATEFDAIFEYIRCFFHIDIFAFHKFHKSIKKDMKTLIDCYETIGFLDAMISIAYFRHHTELSHPACGYCKPNFVGQTLQMKGVYHPLLEHPVENSFIAERSMLITGSNATGKSTFLRTVAINAILEQTIFTVCARAYQAPFFYVMTSMNIRDNINSNDSYFMMEIKSIKRIVDKKDQTTKLLCCIDEVLKGTNTVERISASAEILRAVSRSNAICLAASHDIELASILKQYYANYHFQEYITEGGFSCDYILYHGKTKSRNAIELLKLLGFSDEIVSNARSNVMNYLDSGEWKSFA